MSYLATITTDRLAELYEASQLSPDEISDDYVAGYWARWAEWPRPHASFAQARRGWDQANREKREAA